MILPLVVIIATAGAVSAGIYLTVRAFRASEGRAVGPDNSGHEPAVAGNGGTSRHDHATTEQLKRFFDGKDCAVCKRPIPPVHRTGLKPGLLNPATHEAQSWEEISNVNLSATLESRLPLCAACRVAEAFRQRFGDRVVDRDRTLHDAHSPDRIGAGS